MIEFDGTLQNEEFGIMSFHLNKKNSQEILKLFKNIAYIWNNKKDNYYLKCKSIFYEISYLASLKNNYDYLTFYPCTNVIQVQDNHYNLSVNSFENNGEIFVPLREVLELLGHSVEWNGKTNSIYIDSNIILSRKLVVENF